MNIAISPTELITSLVALVGLLLAGFWSATRLMVGQIVAQFERRLEEKFITIGERFKYLETLFAERHDHLTDGHQERRQEIQTLTQTIQDCRAQCAGRYVTSQEFYELLGPLQAKIEKLTEHVLSNR